MTKISIFGDCKTPNIYMSYDENIYKISGRSIPEDAQPIYDQLLKYMEYIQKMPSKDSVFNIDLDYFNTPSSKYLMFMFDILNKSKNKYTINWYYEEFDEDMLESGEDYQALFSNLTFVFVLKD
jgi:hypothetical protein